MRNIRIFILTALLLGSASCGKDFDDLNVNPNNPSEVSPDFLFTSAASNVGSFNAGYGHTYFVHLWAQHFCQNNYTDESRFRIRPDAINGNWEWLYAGALFDLVEVRRLLPLANTLDPAEVIQNKMAIATVLSVLQWHDITDIFGPVPYSEALQASGNRTPKYDSQKDIYTDLLKRLKEASDQMDPSFGAFGNADPIYGGDVAKWKAFANSLRLRIAMRMADVETTAARAEVEAAWTAAFASNDDNAYFHFLTSQPNNNPINQQKVDRGDADQGLSSVFIDKTLLPLNDPRLPVFADEKVDGGGYAGRPYGQNSGNAASESPDLYSQPSGAAAVRGERGFRLLDVAKSDAVGRFMSYAEVCFILAEAVERQWTGVPGTAAEWYEKGIRASLEEWGITDAAVQDNYLNQTAVAYATADGDWKQKIGVQKWVALFLNGIQGWCEWRRLDFEKLEPCVDGPQYDVGDKPAPVRLTYPTNEQTQNGANYQGALGLLGGPDKLTTRVWWDVE